MNWRAARLAAGFTRDSTRRDSSARSQRTGRYRLGARARCHSRGSGSLPTPARMLSKGGCHPLFDALTDPDGSSTPRSHVEAEEAACK